MRRDALSDTKLGRVWRGNVTDLRPISFDGGSEPFWTHGSVETFYPDASAPRRIDLVVHWLDGWRAGYQQADDSQVGSISRTVEKGA